MLLSKVLGRPEETFLNLRNCPTVPGRNLGMIRKTPAKVCLLGCNTLKWVFEDPNGGGDSSPAIGADGTIYVGSTDGNVYAINPNGNEKWSFTTGGEVFSSPAGGADGTIYVGSTDGNVYAINPNGNEKWSFTTGFGISISSPAVGADGTIYVGSVDNNVYAIDPNGNEKKGKMYVPKEMNEDLHWDVFCKQWLDDTILGGKGGDREGFCCQRSRCFSICFIKRTSVMKLMILIGPLQRGHTRTSTSQIFFMHSRQVFDGTWGGLYSETSIISTSVSTSGSGSSPGLRMPCQMFGYLKEKLAY